MILPKKTITIIFSVFSLISFVLYTVSTSIKENSTLNNFTQPTIASEDLGSQLEAVEKRLAELKLKQQELERTIGSEQAKQSKYGAEVANLSAEISLKANKIETLQLDIEKLQLNIEILNFTVKETEAEIQVKEENIEELEEETQDRLIEMYLDMKSYSDTDVIFNPQKSTDFVKNDLYQKSIQEDTNSDLSELDNQRVELQSKQVQLNEDKIQIEKDKSSLDEQKIALEKEKTVLDQTRASLNQKIKESLDFQKQQEFAYDQSSEAEKKLLGEKEYLKQKILEEIGQIPSGSYVLKGTVIGFEGNTGWSTGPHLHFAVAYNGVTQNPCNHVNCGSRSAGQISWPISPAGTITSGYGQRAYDFHPAIDISTGGTGAIVAAHDGWIGYYKDACYDLTWVRCNGGFAYYALICEDRTNCNNGYKTAYWHMKYQ